MPGMAGAADSRPARVDSITSLAQGGPAEGNPGRTGAENALLLSLQRQALQYFLDNQMPNGLVLDRQHNHGPRRAHGLCSSSATGMGFVALALAAAPPYRLHSRQAAVERIRAGVQAAVEQLPHDHGIMPHFVDDATGRVHGTDHLSTIDSAWLVAGALWAAAFLGDRGLEEDAERLYARIDWRYWTAPEEPATRGLLRHGKRRDGQFLGCWWDRLNGETIFMYVLAAGAADGRNLGPEAWRALQPFYGTVAGLRFHSADLGLFVFQYGMDLLDLRRWQAPRAEELLAEAGAAALANCRTCRAQADTFATFRRFWGLSAGDGPSTPPDPDIYRCYTPAEPADGTAHITATLGSIGFQPDLVLENLLEAEGEHRLQARGRYGFSNINVDRHWVSRDMVGIDVGATVLALDNYLCGDRVRTTFCALSCIQRGMQRLGFRAAAVDPTVENPAHSLRNAS
jgi:hypothetical protein